MERSIEYGWTCHSPLFLLIFRLECTLGWFQKERIRSLLKQITSLGFKESNARSGKSVYHEHDGKTDTANGNMSPLNKVRLLTLLQHLKVSFPVFYVVRQVRMFYGLP